MTVSVKNLERQYSVAVFPRIHLYILYCNDCAYWQNELCIESGSSKASAVTNGGSFASNDLLSKIYIALAPKQQSLVEEKRNQLRSKKAST